MSKTPTIDSTTIEHRTETGAYHAYHDWASGTPLSWTVLEAFSAVADAAGDSTNPMHDSFDVCAIDDLFRTDPDTGPATQGHVAVVHDGYEIEIHTNGLVRIQPGETVRPRHARDSNDGPAARGGRADR